MSTSGERLLAGHSGLMLGILTVGLMVARTGRRALPPLLPTIIDGLSISPFQAGIALSVGSLAFALLQFPSGRLSDQLTRKTVLLASLLFIAAGALLLSGSTNYLLFLVAVAVIGIGEGLYGAADRGLLSDLFVDNRGVAFGLHGTATEIGGIVASGLAVAALSFGVWQFAFPPVIIGTFVVAVILYRVGREPVIFESISPQLQETAVRLFFERRFRWLLVAYSMFAFTSQGVLGFLPALLQADHGFSAGLASIAFAGLFATGIIAGPLAGRLSDWQNRMVIAGTGLLIGGLGLVVLVLAGTTAMAFVGVVIFAIGRKTYPPAIQARLMDAFPDASMAGDLGATRTVYIIVGSLGPAYAGFVGGRLSYTIAFTGFVASFLLGGLIILGLAVTGST